MKVVSAALHPIVLIGLAGFAAGALLVGTVALGSRPVPTADESLRVPVTSRTAQDAVRVETTSIYAPDRLAVAGPWPFESATPASERATGKMRPDRLSAPEGWTYDAAGQTE